MNRKESIKLFLHMVKENFDFREEDMFKLFKDMSREDPFTFTLFCSVLIGDLIIVLQNGTGYVGLFMTCIWGASLIGILLLKSAIRRKRR